MKGSFMLIICLERLNEFSKKHANAKRSLAAWKNKQDVLKDFPKAKMIANNKARFEIVHNTYRLIAYIDYADQIVEIRIIGTHTEYDRINPAII